MFVFAIKLSFS